ncbi:zinc ribbon domain-containing protein [Facklamia sp. DSM 111018]|uniref:Zinc ribbon domain-containing protein n=1 Tax=Facklamia lactis TaxID=2749967 RepID=A0ABS0LSX4_9LACT|nr:zinc ribbon domain-containing protein [Facklamia lactis]MBG9981410.1 zinc ribbon domain-containing protein [Facklamia lactis]MBG9987114.1 zinc ribbon domain-containing protein [Facklamia lactis]
MKQCSQCLYENYDEAKYCSECGRLIEDDALKIEEPVKVDQNNQQVEQEGQESQRKEEELVVSRMDRYHKEEDVETPSINNVKVNRQQLIGILLMGLSFVMLIGNYYFNHSQSAVSQRFLKAMEKQDYDQAATVVTSPISTSAWTGEDIIASIEHYKQAGLDMLTLLEEGSLEQGIAYQDHLILKNQVQGRYFFLFPKYKVQFIPLSINFSLSNNYRDLKLIAEGQKDQSVAEDGGIFIEPRIKEVILQFKNKGSSEEVLMDLDYSQVETFRHRLSLTPVDNELSVNKMKSGFRSSLPFELVSYQIDGQEYQQDKIALSGYLGQSFEISIKAKYNDVLMESSPIAVRLREGDKLELDFSHDAALQEQIRQAELN